MREMDEKGIANGKAQLFDTGILQMSWTMKNGKTKGELTVYKKGVVDYKVRWKDLKKNLKNLRYSSNNLPIIVNSKNGKQFLEEVKINSGVVVYRGEFNSETYEREGFGVEFDAQRGKEIRSGYYKSGKLIHIYQEFYEVIDDFQNWQMEMIEYGGDKDEKNAGNILKRRPIYIGEYEFDEEENKFIRSGIGHELNENSGICETICEWDGEGGKREEREIKLHGGWYGEGFAEDHLSIRLDNLEKEEEGWLYWNKEIAICPELNFSQPRSIEELVIGDNLYNDGSDEVSILKMDLSNFHRLKRVRIGNDSFMNVRELVIDGLPNLESVKIGNSCFTLGDGERADGICRITNCPNLRRLEIGNDSFADFKSFELSNVNSLQSIKFGYNCFLFSDLSLKGE